MWEKQEQHIRRFNAYTVGGFNKLTWYNGAKVTGGRCYFGWISCQFEEA